MTNKIDIYVVLHCEGEYEDYKETPVCAYLNEKQAKCAVTRWNKKQVKSKYYYIEAKYVTIKLHNSIFC